MITHIPVSECSACGTILDVSRRIDDDAVPTPGDVSVCFYCGHVTLFDHDLSLRELSAEEAARWADDPEIAKAVRFAKAARRKCEH